LRVQAVLPGATATNFWNAAGSSVESLPGEIVMRTEDLVDAAFVGFDRGELVTIPPLESLADWNTYETARQAMLPNLSRDVPATRYRIAAAA
jgi:short-subunit dehydrogenase